MSCDECDTKSEIQKTCLSDYSSDDDSDSSYRSDNWEDKIIVLGPESAWEKPEGHGIYITQVSISPPHDSSDLYGVFTIMAKDFNVVIAKLTKENPVQMLRLPFNTEQDAILLNNGNRSITIALMIRQ